MKAKVSYRYRLSENLDILATYNFDSVKSLLDAERRAYSYLEEDVIQHGSIFTVFGVMRCTLTQIKTP